MSHTTILTPEGVTITGITYTIDKSGVVDPVIQIEPPMHVSYSDGRSESSFEVSRIPLTRSADAGYEDIGIGSRVRVCRDDVYISSDEVNLDIIPTALSSRITIRLMEDSPELAEGTPRLVTRVCPGCHSVLRIQAGEATCVNPLCPSQILQRCVHFLKSVRVYLHGPFYQILCMLVARGYVRTVSDIFYIDPRAVQSTADFVDERYLQTFLDLIHEPVGHTSMTDVLIGLSIWTEETCHDTLHIQDFVSHLQQRMRDEQDIDLTLRTLIDYVDDVVAGSGVYVDPDTDRDQTGQIYDQISKLDDSASDALHEMTGPLNDFEIAQLIQWIYVPEHRHVLENLNDLDFVGV